MSAGLTISLSASTYGRSKGTQPPLDGYQHSNLTQPGGVQRGLAPSDGVQGVSPLVELHTWVGGWEEPPISRVC